eukprot:TRINITY_DN124_c0_g2_i1.p1 TRINITY_DN124_c0_g2~~TRINITY_DN124_c0_g2_i1.p1  ORF type:complete len:1488 (+),score=212.99 TRINITY_DN124_c0_g2_i1:207-4466(+)
MAWEDLCGVLSLETLCLRPESSEPPRSHDPSKTPIIAVAYVLRPHACNLGGKHLQRVDVRGAIVVTNTLAEVEEWQTQLDVGDVCTVANETELLEQVVKLVRRADPDLCVGWELRSRSWGLLMARARALGLRDLRGALSRTPFDGVSYPLPSSGASLSSSVDSRALDSDLIAPSDLQLPGRILLNVWRVLAHLTFGAKLRSDAPQEAARELLERTIPSIRDAELIRLWHKGSHSRHSVLQHLQAIAALSLEVFDTLEVLPRAGELARLFGMDVISCFTRGTQFNVESVLMRVAKAADFVLLSAMQQQVRSQPALECLPLVMEPASGFYWDPVLVLDFKGMYPSLIVAHNISFDTCLGRMRRAGSAEQVPTSQLGVREAPRALGSLDAVQRFAQKFDEQTVTSSSADSPLRVLPSGVVFVAPDVHRGLVPMMLDWAIGLRNEAKKAMKVAPSHVARRLNQRQFALKYFANVTYGYAGASFSGRMPCAEVADAIVACGRSALEEAADYIEASLPGAKVIYGDTDSLFVQMAGATLEEAFVAGRQLCAEISALHPSPVELEFEKVYYPCVCLTKKRYGGMAFAKPPSEGGSPQFEAKGLEAVRRDQCRLTSDTQRDVLVELLRTKDLSAAKRVFVDRVSKLLRGGLEGPPLPDLVFNREARLGTYRAEEEDGNGATLPPQAVVAHSRQGLEGAPQFGERVSYVVTCKHPNARLIDKCTSPTESVEGGCHSAHASSIDRWWYAEKAILPSIARILHSELYGLSSTDVNAWLRYVPRPSTSRMHTGTGAGSKGLMGLLRRSSCSVCKQNEAVRNLGVCGQCASSEVRLTVRKRFNETRVAYEALRSTCVKCAGTCLWQSCEAAAHCDVFGKRVAAETVFLEAESDVRSLGVTDDVHGDVTIISDDDGASVHDEVKSAPEVHPGSSQTARLPMDSAPKSGDTAETTFFEVLDSDDDIASVTNARASSEATTMVSAPPLSLVPVAGGASASSASVPCCKKHGEPCKSLEVKKEGPNLGRRFFACARPREEQCNFFAWADAPTSNSRAAGEHGVAAPSTPQRKRKVSSSNRSMNTPKRKRTGSFGGQMPRVRAPGRSGAERIERAMEHRLMLIRSEIVDQGTIAVSVLGHTGNVYDARLGPRVECSCPDFAKTKRVCKHLIFVFVRVLGVPREDPRIWQQSLQPPELRELQERLRSQTESSSDGSTIHAPDSVVCALDAIGPPVIRRPLGDVCPVCFDQVLALPGTTCCVACGRNVHGECFAQWRSACVDVGVGAERANTPASSSTDTTLVAVLSGAEEQLAPPGPLSAAARPTCPACRREWSEDLAKEASQTLPGRPLPRRKLNLAAHSVLHALPEPLEETYPVTHKWIRRRESGDPARDQSGKTARQALDPVLPRQAPQPLLQPVLACERITSGNGLPVLNLNPM